MKEVENVKTKLYDLVFLYKLTGVIRVNTLIVTSALNFVQHLLM